MSAPKKAAQPKARPKADARTTLATAQGVEDLQYSAVDVDDLAAKVRAQLQATPHDHPGVQAALISGVNLRGLSLEVLKALIPIILKVLQGG